MCLGMLYVTFLYESFSFDARTSDFFNVQKFPFFNTEENSFVMTTKSRLLAVNLLQ